MRIEPLALIVSVTLALSADGEDRLSFSIHANPQTVRLGQRVSFTFSYRNNADRTIGIIPEYYAYEALDVHLTNVDSRVVGEMFPYLGPHIDPDLARKNFRLLKPGQTYRRTLTAVFGSSLPEQVAASRRKPGFYLLFADSAIKVPAFGKYKATSRYLGIAAYRNELSAPAREMLWIGKTFAPPITIEFRR